MKRIMKITTIVFLILLTVGILLFCYARLIEPNLLCSKKVTVTTDKITGEPIKIVMFGDTHFSKRSNAEQAVKLTKEINQHQPDLVLFVGDLMDSYAKSPPNTEEMIRALESIEATHGKFAVFGNHDRGGGASRVYEDFMGQGGFRVLVNEAVALSEINLNILGIDDVLLGKPDYQIGKKTQDGAFNLLLAHEPDFVDSISLDGIDLVNSGHTHGGQVRLPFLTKYILPKGGKNYLRDLYRLNQTGTQLYVTGGVGTTALPFRFRSVPEVVVITLEPKQ